MVRRLIHIVALIVVTTFAACNNINHNVEMHDTEQSLWAKAEEFVYDNTDTLSKRDIAVVVRYGNGYVTDSVALSILSKSPDSMVVEEPFTLRIPQLSDMRPAEHTFPYRRNVTLRRSGEYRFRLTPSAAVEGISSVGILITEPQALE